VVGPDNYYREVNGTSIETPGGYAIRGVTTHELLRMVAFMDVTGSRRLNVATDPYVITKVNYQGGRLTANLTLEHLPASPPGKVSLEGVIPHDGTAVVIFKNSEDAQGYENADSYKIYYNMDPRRSPVSAPIKIQTVPAAARFHIVPVEGLTNGKPYYFQVVAFAGKQESEPSKIAGTVVGIPLGGSSVVGTVSLAGLDAPSGAMLYVIVHQDAGAYLTRVVNPSGLQRYAIQGVNDGVYSLIAFLDMKNDGLTADDPKVGFDEGSTFVKVDGVKVQAPDLAMPSVDFIHDATTNHYLTQEGKESKEHYSVSLAVEPNVKRPFAVTLCSGPDVIGPIDVPASSRDDGFRYVAHRGGISPVMGHSYHLDVTSDSGTARVISQVTGVVGIPVALAPKGPIFCAKPESCAPTFTWMLPNPAPPSYVQRLSVRSMFGGGDSDVWKVTLPSGATNAKFNFNGKAEQPLIPGMYRWWPALHDPYGNQGTAEATFTVALGP
jgi:hypothetical protein